MNETINSGLKLSEHDRSLVEVAIAAIANAVANAESSPAVAKRIASVAMRFRNRGRRPAIRRYPFRGICEASGLPLENRDAVLDELEPELGYAGQVRWICEVANNSGTGSCGGCKRRKAVKKKNSTRGPRAARQR
jgi:hypothetical protein